MENKGISIIITAYNTANYIEECLDSVYAQTWFKKRKKWEVLVGIDHCKETLAKVHDVMEKYPNIKVFYMFKNVGTYIASNTLISKAKYDKILRFDSDDIMKADMVESMLNIMDESENIEIVRCYYEEFPKEIVKKTIPFATHGIFLCRKSVFTKYGGFMPWKCAADTEFHKRLEKKVNSIICDKVLFYRRIHENSLTKSKGTSMHSALRASYKKYIIDTSPTVPIIKTTTTFCKEIFINEDINDILSESEQEKTVIIDQPKYVKRVIPNAKTIKRISSATYTGV